jgi:hypothetical protein
LSAAGAPPTPGGVVELTRQQVVALHVVERKS